MNSTSKNSMLIVLLLTLLVIFHIVFLLSTSKFISYIEL